MILCGFVAGFMYSRGCRAANVPFGAGPGAAAGVLSGAIHGVTAVVVSLIARKLFGEVDLIGMFEWAREMPDLPDESMTAIDDALDNLYEGAPMTALEVVLNLLGKMVVGTVFGTIGGLIAGVAFRYDPPPPAPPAPPVPPATPTPPAPPEPPADVRDVRSTPAGTGHDPSDGEDRGGTP